MFLSLYNALKCSNTLNHPLSWWRRGYAGRVDTLMAFLAVVASGVMYNNPGSERFTGPVASLYQQRVRHNRLVRKEQSDL
jgi:hypothetical protein